MAEAVRETGGRACSCQLPLFRFLCILQQGFVLQGMLAHRQSPPSVSHPQVDYMHEETKGITYTPTFALYKQGRKVRWEELSARCAACRGCRRACAMKACLCHSRPAADCRVSHAAWQRCAALRCATHALPCCAVQVDQFFGANGCSSIYVMLCCAVLCCAGGPILWGQRAAAAGPPVALDPAARQQDRQRWFPMTVGVSLNPTHTLNDNMQLPWQPWLTHALHFEWRCCHSVYYPNCLLPLAGVCRPTPCSQHCTDSHLTFNLKVTPSVPNAHCKTELTTTAAQLMRPSSAAGGELPPAAVAPPWHATGARKLQRGFRSAFAQTYRHLETAITPAW